MIGEEFVGRYTVIEHIGRGGMQDVYRAHDSLRDIDVALKVPQAGQIDKKFRNSAVIAARINHHNVAKTLDYFEDAGRPYLVEEIVEGGTLDDALANYSFFDPHTGTRMLRLLAKGLAASHHAGVVHRDLKPSNVVVTGGYGLSDLKITDFGIATLTEEVFEEEIVRSDITKTTSGTVKGALPYMSPEMMFRKPGEVVGMEADVWSLGAMMFHMVTGMLPFGEGFHAPANVSSGNITSWPAFMTAKETFRQASESLQEVIITCLQTDPSKRPTADELVSVCADLVYFHGEWTEGKVRNMPASTFGFISSAKGKAFFHVDSVYGPNAPKENSKVLFCASTGVPHDRAFPVLVCS